MDALAALESARGASPDSPQVSAALDVLTELDSDCASWVIEAMELHYLDGHTWRQVGAALGYSAVHVRRTVHRVLASTRDFGSPPRELPSGVGGTISE